MPGRTQSKTIRFSDTPMVQFLATIEEPPLSSPVENREGSSHSAGLTFIKAKTTLLSVLGPRAVNDAGHHKEPSAWGTAGSSHSAGLTFIIAKTTLLSVLGPRAVNDAGHHKEPSAWGTAEGGCMVTAASDW